MSEPLTPKKLGRYEIVRELGKGAMGVVYEGRDPNIGRRVAIKTARRDVLERSPQAAEMLERFLREAKAAGALSHPNIITIYDAAEEEGMAYIAMEFLEGGDLREVIEARRKLDPEEIAELGATICEALATAHDQGVIHRDIKPANILMPTNAPLKVADFGIAHVQDSTLTQDGALIGTPYYMSPEQFMGQKVDGRSDLFSAGIIVYELLTGEKPFTGEAVSTIMQHVIRTMPVPPQDLNFNCPTPLSQVIMKALAKRPAERYQDGRAMAAALREAVKPNPNKEVLGLVSSGIDHDAPTIVTEAAGTATVVAGAGAASSPTQSDLAATTPTGASAPDTAATIHGTPPPGATAAGLAGVTGNTYAAPTITSRARLAGAAGLVALVLGILAFAMGPLLGEKTVEGGAEPDKWIDSIALQIYGTEDPMSLLDFDYKRANLPGDAVAVPGRVVISDETGTQILEQDVKEEGSVIDLPGHPTQVTIKWYAILDGPQLGEGGPDTWYAKMKGEKIGMEDTALLTHLK